MKITKIEEQKKHKNRMSIFLDGEFAFGIDAFSFYALRLKEGDEIDSAFLSEIKQKILYEDAKNRAAKLLSARSYTARDMKRKLLEYTGDEAVAEKTLAFLKEYRLIDDSDYARRFASDCLRLKKLGKRSIRFKLLEKGISPDLADKVLEDLGSEDLEADNLEKLLIKKLNGNYEFKNLMKAKRYLFSKGYGFDEIDNALNKLKAESEDWSSC